jgi:hypothetical protein
MRVGGAGWWGQVTAAVAERLAALKAKNAAMNRQAADAKLRGACPAARAGPAQPPTHVIASDTRVTTHVMYP